MALLFFGGIMNVLWIAGLAIYVLFEKTVPAGHWLAQVAGVLLVAAGTIMVVGA
jgi:predicted metal-binding membrane protein